MEALNKDTKNDRHPKALGVEAIRANVQLLSCRCFRAPESVKGYRGIDTGLMS